jgi:hypothetical protein
MRLYNTSILIITIIFLFTASAAANVFEDMYGICTDPLKLYASSHQLAESLERTLNQLKDLEHVANYDMKNRIEQIRNVVNEAISGEHGAITHATESMLQIENQVNADAINLLYRASCAAHTLLMGDLQQSFAGIIKTLKKANPELYIGGIKILNSKIMDVEIEDPDKAYISTRDAALQHLDKSIENNSSAYEILSTYQNLIHIAKLTRCYYIDQSLATKFDQEVNKLEILSLPWMELNPVMKISYNSGEKYEVTTCYKN